MKNPNRETEVSWLAEGLQSGRLRNETAIAIMAIIDGEGALQVDLLVKEIEMLKEALLKKNKTE